HRANGLPTQEEIVALLKQLDVPHAVLDNAPLDVWLPMLLLAENLLERQAATELVQRVNAPFFRGERTGRPIPYRKVYVCAKSFDATAALEPSPDLAFPANLNGALPAGAAVLNCLSRASGDALSGREK